MKKIAISLVFLTLLFTFLSCSASDHISDFKERLSSPFEYKIQTDEFEFTYVKEPDKVTMTVTSPSTLEGLTLEKTASGIVASYDGLVVTLPAAAAARLFALDTLVDAVLKAIGDNTYTTKTANGETALTVTDNNKTYTVLYDPGTGKITSAVVAEGDDRTTYTFVN